MNLTSRATVRHSLLVLGLLLLIAGAAFGVSNRTFWPQFHFDQYLAGFNTDCTDLQALDPNSTDTGSNMGLIWTYPMPMADTGNDSLRTVDDDSAVLSGFGNAAGTINATFPSNAYNAAFHWDNGKEPAYVNNKPTPPSGLSTATWALPAVPTGHYTVYVWFPSSPQPQDPANPNDPGKLHTTKAQYTVISDAGPQTYEIDQTNGGDWVELGERGFTFTGGSATEGVTLSNYTPDYDPVANPSAKPVIVCADAVRWVPTTNQSIYSSAASAIYTYGTDMPNYRQKWHTSDGVPVAYIGTVENPSDPGATSTGMAYGSMYCVNSDTAQQLDDVNSLTYFGGRAIWRYPTPIAPGAPGCEDLALGTTPWPSFTGTRGPLEGPIQGGIYGSPAVVYQGANPIVYFTGMDKQVYCVDGFTGQLIWRGPGMTVSEDATPSSWGVVSGREDAFGGNFYSTTAVAGTTSTNVVEWKATGLNTTYTGGTARNYSIYVWLPRRQGTDLPRVQTATYKIAYNSTEATVVVNQDSASPSGQWVKLGDSYLNPTLVTLMDTTTANDLKDSDGNPVVKEVVADAIEFIPDLIQEFSYSSPVVAGGYVYVGNVNGRVYSLSAAAGSVPGTTTEHWVFPEVQSTLAVTPTTGDQPPLGPIVAAPAIDSAKDVAYIASMNGRVYRLGAISGAKPTYDEDNDQFPAKFDPAKPETTAKGGFSSSPAIDNSAGGMVYVASVDGQVFQLDTGAKLKANWTWPIDPGTAGVSAAVGAFRYSTPAITPDGVYFGSTDGNVYALEKGSTPTPKWDWNLSSIANDPQNAGQVLSGPIQSSPAIDNANYGTNIPTIFCGTMTGDVWWLNANTGGFGNISAGGNTWAGKHIGNMVFSSPSVAEVTTTNVAYMYVGSDDGRLYAFSKDANGGNWAGAYWGIPEPSGSSSLKQPDPTLTIQAQVVDDQTLADIRANPPPTGTNQNPLLKIVTPLTKPEDAVKGHVIGKGLRKSGHQTEVIYEWGEKINVVAWNLNKSADIESVRIEMFSSSRKGDAANPGSGGVESGSAPKAAQLNSSSCVDYLTNIPDPNDPGKTLTKSYVTHEFNIPRDWLTSNSGRPPGAGSAWIINVTVRVKGGTVSGKQQPSTNQAGTVPELKADGMPNDPVTNTKVVGATQTRWKPQYVSVNNPLAIKAGGTGLGWTSDRYDVMARVNGTGASGISAVGNLGIPKLDVGTVNHGTNSMIQWLGAMDRSCMGLSGQALDRFRVDASDLYWQGGEMSVVNLLPWDFPPTLYNGDQQLFSGLTSSYVGAQKDYPDIRERYENFKKMSDGGNPVRGNTTLTRAIGLSTAPDARTVVADPIQVYVDVPRFQPANTNGYSATMQAYLDMTNNGSFDDGNFIMGQPTAYVEPFRPFRVRLAVAADYRVRVEESVIDLGKAPHGLGHQMPLWDPFEQATAPAGPWFREFTVKNLGNVNITNVVAAPWALGSTQSGIPIDGSNVITSLDSVYDSFTGKFQPSMDTYGHTISKARVGDTDPTVLTIPDSRPYEWMSGAPSEFPKPKVGLIAPLTQPTGTYAGIVPIQYGAKGQFGYAQPTFVLKATVREDRMTGGATEGALPQIDAPSDTLSPSIGDVQPAAYRDFNPKDLTEKHSAHMFFASDRDVKGKPVTPNSPWFLYDVNLNYDPAKGWLPIADKTGPFQWWDVTTDASGTPLQIPPPTFTWPSSGAPGDIVLGTYKYMSPSIAQDQSSGQAWLFWQGQVQRSDNGRLTPENLLFYKDVTSGMTGNDFPSLADFTMVKYAPRAVAYTRDSNSWLWLFYYGGNAGRWSIFYNSNLDSGGTKHDKDKWTQDKKLATPDGLNSVSEPMAVYRTITDTADPKITHDYLDVTYTGVSKEGQNSDIYMSRYKIPDDAASNPLSVSISQVSFPRVVDELMARDDRRGLYVAKTGIWWTRPGKSDGPTVTVTLPDGTVLDATGSAGASTPARDIATGVFVITYDSTNPCALALGQTIIDPGSGTVRFRKPLKSQSKVVVSYTPRALKLTNSADSDTSPFVVMDKTPDTMPTIGPSTVTEAPPVDRMWLFWRKPASGVRATTIFYKTRRLTVDLSKPIRKFGTTQKADMNTPVTVTGNVGPYEIDWVRHKVYFTEADERYPGVGPSGPITVEYTAVDPSDPSGSGTSQTDPFPVVSWKDELPEAALLGNAAESMVNEGQVCAFTEPELLTKSGDTDWPLGRVAPRMWVFWTSTRTGQADIFYETLSPVFRQ